MSKSNTNIATADKFKLRSLSIAMSWSAFGSFFSLIGRFTVGILIARALTPNDFAAFSYLIWLVGFICSIGSFGIVYSTSREAAIFLSQNDTHKAAFITNFGLKILGIAFLLVCSSILIISREYWNTGKMIIAFLLIIAGGQMFGSWAIGWFSTYLNHKKISIINIISIIVLLIGVIFFRRKASLELFLSVYAVSYCVQLIVALRLFPIIKKLGIGININKGEIKKLLSLGIVYWITIIGAAILRQRFEIAYLKIFSSQIEIAKFAAASQISAIVIYSVTLFTTPISQYTARLSSNGELSCLGDRWRFLNKYMALLSMVPTVFIISNSEVILHLLYGTKYVGLGNLLSLLAFSAFILGISSISSGVVFGLGKPKINLLSIFLTIPIIVLLAAIIIPNMGAMGAAFTRIAGYGLSLMLLFVFIWRKIGPPIRSNSLIKLIVLFILSMISAYLPSLFIEQWFIRLVSSIMFELIIFLLMFRVLKLIESDEKTLIESTLNRLPEIFRKPLFMVYNFSIAQ